MKLRNALLAATVMALPAMTLPGTAQAQPVTGLYIAGGAGANFQHNFRLSEPVFNPNGSASSEVGFVGLGSIGWGFGNGLRVELEGSWRAHRINRITPGAWRGGRTDQIGGMVNALYDFNGVSSFMVPYIGAGVGAVWRIPTRVPYAFWGSSKEDVNFGWQVIAGAAFPMPSIDPGLSFTAEYRYMGHLATTHAAQTFPTNVRLGDSHNHSVLLGVRYEFNKAPPPAPAAAVAPAAATRSFLVFFDWDKFNLTDRARQVIREAAATSKQVQVTRIEVNGYADTSGNPRYNMGLSMRRAQTVAAELVRNGVARNQIAIKAFGDTVLLVPTGPGVREPQNRRVEIILR